MIDWVKKLTGELIDIVEWLDDSTNTLVYRYERHNNEIKYGAKLTVREGQMA
ncbi:MAG: SPFH domain-containing protein, partial [Betaproteobacteria bacterium]